MLRELLKSKLHRATVTEANLHYVGSITIDRELMDAVDLVPNEKVLVVNNANGARFETYVIEGRRGSGVICLNGAAARLVQPGDPVIIMAFGWLTADEIPHHRPKVAILDAHNKIAQLLDHEQAHTIA